MSAAGVGPAQVHYNPLRGVPVLGGLINTTVNGPLHSVGIANEAAGNVAQGITGEGLLALALITKMARAASGPDIQETPGSRLVDQILAQGPMHPGRVVEAARHFDNPLISIPTGAIEMGANPLNYAGAIGEAGAGLEAAGKAPAIGAALRNAGTVLDAVNRVQGLPLALTKGARSNLLPEVFGAAKTPAETVLASQAAREALGRPKLPPGGVPPRHLLLADGPTPPPVQIPLRLGRDVPLPPAPIPFPPRAGTQPLDQLGSETIPPALASGLNPQDFATMPPARAGEGHVVAGRARTKFEQIMDDLGPTDTPQEFRRKAEVARILLGDEGNYLTGKGEVEDFPLPFANGPIVPGGGVTLAEERAAQAAATGPLDHPSGIPQTAAPDMPGYQGQTRRGALGALTSDEIDNLVNIAYPVEKAQANAILAHPDPTELADAAINRITAPDTSGRPLAARLQQLHPDLAQKIAFLPDPEEAVQPAQGYGGDIAAGGGGMGIVPARLGSTLAGAAAGTGIGGLAGGGLGLAAGHRGDQLKEDIGAGAALGGLTGGSVGSVAPELQAAFRANAPQITQAAQQVAQGIEGKFSDNTMRNPEVWIDALTYGARDQERSFANKGIKPNEAWGAFWQRWGSQAVLTLKQLPQDALQRLVVLKGVAGKEFGIGAPQIEQAQGEAREVLMGRMTPEQDSVGQWFAALGRPDLNALRGDIVGTTPAEALAGKGTQMGGLGRGISGALMGVASGIKHVNPIAPLYGAVRGYLAPFLEGAITFLNTMQHDGFRNAMLTAGLDRDMPQVGDAFLQSLQGRGIDVAPLAGRGGRFSAQEVEQLAGAQAGQDWATLAEATVRAVGDRAAFLAGDFRKSSETGVERAISKVAPFSRWSIRNAPVLAEIAARHPRAAMLVLGELAREGGKGIEFDDTTPLIGPIARLRNGGSPGKMGVKPLEMVVPYTNFLDTSRQGPEDPTGYQRLTGAANMVGFGPNPAIQALAYVTGQGTAPGALSRTAGLESAADVAPALIRAGLRASGNPDLADRVPDVGLPSGRTILDAARNVVAPAVEKAGLPTTGGGPSDPAERRYAELVLAQTQKPLMDPANRRYLETMGESDNPLWQMAILQSRAAGAVGNVASMTSPAQTTAQTTQAAAAQAAPKLPYTSYDISQAPAAQRPAMLAANAAAVRANPASATYTNISGKSRTDQLIGQWELEHIALKRVNPTYYAMALKNYKDSLK